MNINIWKFLFTQYRFKLSTLQSILLALMLCGVNAQAGTQIQTLNGQGSISTSTSPVTAASSIPGTPVQHTGDPAGTITTNISPDSTVPQINGTPVKNSGGGSITTTTGPEVAQTAPAINAKALLAAPLASDPAFQVSANCDANAVGIMTIANVGGDMTIPFTWRISLNGTPITQNSFQINAGQTFNISTSGLFGTLALDVLDATNTVVASGSMLCVAPPPPPPPVPPAFQVSANCAANATGLMTITNIGGNMTTPFTWRISQDGTPIAQNTFQVSPGQTFNISTSGLFGTLVMDVLDTTNTVVASGSMLCQLPAPPPPAFNVSGQCGANAIGSFTITDVGGDMTLPFTWRIEQKDDRKWSLISKNTFQINAGQSTQINTKRHFGTLRLSVLDKSKGVLATGSIVCKHSGH